MRNAADLGPAGRTQHRHSSRRPHPSSRYATTTTSGRPRRPHSSSRSSTPSRTIDVVFSGIRAMTDTKVRRPNPRLRSADAPDAARRSRRPRAHLHGDVPPRGDIRSDRVVRRGDPRRLQRGLRVDPARRPSRAMAIVREPLVDMRWGTGVTLLGPLAHDRRGARLPARRVPRVRHGATRPGAGRGTTAPSRARRRGTARKRGRRSARRSATIGASRAPTWPRSSRPAWPARARPRVPATDAATASERAPPGSRETAGLPVRNPAVRARAKRTQRE